MRVYFIGGHAVGKTTLARYVSEKYKIPMITEVARMILSEKELHLDALRTDLILADQYQENIFYRQIEEEKKHINFVSDRSIDCLAYSAQHSRILSQLLKSKELEEYIKVLKDPGSFVFFVRPSKVTLKEDGVRESLTWDGVVTIDAMVKFILEMFNLRNFQINTDNMRERAQLIDNVLNL